MKSIPLMSALAALPMCMATSAFAQTAAPTYLAGNQVVSAQGTFVVDKSGNPIGTSINPLTIYDINTAAIAAAINAPLNAQTTHGVIVGAIEGSSSAGNPGAYPVTVQPQSGGFAVTATGAVTSAVNSSGATPIVQSDSSVAINVAAAGTTQLIAAASGKAIYIAGWDIVVGSADNVTLEYGSGVNCGTGTTPLTGAYSFTANGGLTIGSGLGVLMNVPAGNALCIVTSAAAQASGRVSYAQF